MKSLLHVFAGSDGKTALVAVQASLGVLTFLGLAVWHVIGRDRPFDMAAFSESFAVVLGASGAAIGGHSYLAAKADAIPSPPASGGS